jgi:hypothetical protein
MLLSIDALNRPYVFFQMKPERSERLHDVVLDGSFRDAKLKRNFTNGVVFHPVQPEYLPGFVGQMGNAQFQSLGQIVVGQPIFGVTIVIGQAGNLEIFVFLPNQKGFDVIQYFVFNRSKQIVLQIVNLKNFPPFPQVDEQVLNQFFRVLLRGQFLAGYPEKWMPVFAVNCLKSLFVPSLEAFYQYGIT